MPVGLIVNELVTNAIKYAFKVGDQGRVVVRFRVRGKHALLTISDNGRGLEGTNTREGVGRTRLVRDLAKQIGATVRVIRRPSCAYSFRFKMSRSGADGTQPGSLKTGGQGGREPIERRETL